MSIEYSEALALPLGLGVSELVNATHCLCQVPTHMPNQLKEVVFIECLSWNPKGYVLEASGILAVRFELSDVSPLELV